MSLFITHFIGALCAIFFGTLYVVGGSSRDPREGLFIFFLSLIMTGFGIALMLERF